MSILIALLLSANLHAEGTYRTITESVRNYTFIDETWVRVSPSKLEWKVKRIGEDSEKVLGTMSDAIHAEVAQFLGTLESWQALLAKVTFFEANAGLPCEAYVIYPVKKVGKKKK